MDDKIHLKATIDRVNVDREGEAKITIIVPLSHRKEALVCAELTEQVIDVIITPETGKQQF